MSVKFEDNSIEIIGKMDDLVTKFLYEAAGELTSQVARNTVVDTGNTKGSWSYTVDQKDQKAIVGSSLQNAIYEEFGTGEYAIGGKGRKGSWVYKSDKDGKYHRTKGKKPRRPFEKAYTTLKPKISAMAEKVLKEIEK